MRNRPWMDDEHIAIIDAALLSFKRPIHVHEWGCGASTIYWTRLLSDSGHRYTWTAVEHHPYWADYVVAMTGEMPVDVRIFDYGTSNIRWLCAASYVESCNQQTDVAIVDGRKRLRCVNQAVKHLSNDGIVFLHDAQRRGYAPIARLGGTTHPGEQGYIWVYRGGL
jgi:predicted O-methyltransferase YrrM